MNIIKSKYSAKELNEIYEREMAKVDKKARDRAWKFDLDFTIVGLLVFLVLWFFVFMVPTFKDGINRPVLNTDWFSYACFLIAAIASMGVCHLLSGKAQTLLYKHYRKQGKILESPLEDCWLNIRFIERGEKLQALMSSELNMEVLYNEYGSFGEKSFTLLKKDSSTGIFTETEEVRVGSLVKDEDWDKFMLPDGTLDFSIYDKNIEEALNKVKKEE